MINDNTVSLPVCAFGAGLGHVAALALVLPLMITLPAPGGTAPKLVAIDVAVLAAEPEPAAPEPVVPDPIGVLMEKTVGEAATAPPPEMPPQEAVTGALPETGAGETSNATDEERAVAGIDPAAPIAVPIPLRKPTAATATTETEKIEPAAPQRAAAPRSSTRAPARARSVGRRGPLGVLPATETFRYPVPGRLPGSGG